MNKVLPFITVLLFIGTACDQKDSKDPMGLGLPRGPITITKSKPAILDCKSIDLKGLEKITNVKWNDISLKYEKIRCVFQNEKGVRISLESYVSKSQRSYLVMVRKSKLIQNGCYYEANGHGGNNVSRQ